MLKIFNDSYLLEAREWGYFRAAVELSIGIGMVFPKAIGRYFCQAPANANQIMLVTFRRPFREGHYEVFFCKDCE